MAQAGEPDPASCQEQGGGQDRRAEQRLGSQPACERFGRQDIQTLAPDAIELLLLHDWSNDGNIRGLVHTINRSVLLAPLRTKRLKAEHVQLGGGSLSPSGAHRESTWALETSSRPLARVLPAAEKESEQKRLLDDAQLKLRDAFATVSAEALAKNNEAFLQLARERFTTLSTEAAGSLEQRKAQIEGLLKPMQELLNTYQGRLADIERSRVESYSMLREQLGVLAETQRTLNTQTSQLVSALRRPRISPIHSATRVSALNTRREFWIRSCT